MGFKAGIGTSSRKLGAGPKAGVVAVLVQANFSGTLTVSGVPIARRAALATVDAAAAQGADERRGNSCMIVVAT